MGKSNTFMGSDIAAAAVIMFLGFNKLLQHEKLMKQLYKQLLKKTWHKNLS